MKRKLPTQEQAIAFARRRIEEVELVTNMTPMLRSKLRLGLTLVKNDYEDLGIKLPTALALRFEDAVEKVQLLTGGE